MGKVTVQETSVVIPTYKPCAAEKGPLFIEKRAYQGSSGKVYPLPVTERIISLSIDGRNIEIIDMEKTWRGGIVRGAPPPNTTLRTISIP